MIIVINVGIMYFTQNDDFSVGIIYIILSYKNYLPKILNIFPKTIIYYY